MRILRTLVPIVFVFFFCVWLLIGWRHGRFPSYVLYAIASMSALTFCCYWFDKVAAGRLAWRVPNATLHTLALFGGWPGALIAQQLFRHKTRQYWFLLATWLFVGANIFAIREMGLGYFFSRAVAFF